MNRFEKIAGKMIEAWEKMTWTRDFFIPKKADHIEKITPEGTDIEAYYYEQNGVSYGMAFSGRANKPLWHYRFKNRERFDKTLEETVVANKSRREMMDKRKQERLNYKHELKEGDILYSSWGYDQTNVDWYQVTAVGEKSVKIREIGGKMVSDDRVVAVPNSFQGPEMRKLVNHRGSVKINSFAWASKWDGRPMYETPAEMGH